MSSTRGGDLVAIVGTTGVGKSQLAVDLALALPTLGLSASPRSAEIINSDSMQVYRGLDVVTNKATEPEMGGISHHLMGFLDPGEEYRVGDFQRDALNKVCDLRCQLPSDIVKFAFQDRSRSLKNGMCYPS